jgi:hypothetical protein
MGLLAVPFNPRGGLITEFAPVYVPSSRHSVLPGPATDQKFEMRNGEEADEPVPPPVGEA